MRTALIIALASVLAGCATHPRQVADQYDFRFDRFFTQECRSARQAAQHYDDNVAARAAGGFAAGLLLGPLGIPIGIAADVAQAKHREEVIAELRRSCEGPPPGLEGAPVPTKLRARSE